MDTIILRNLRIAPNSSNTGQLQEIPRLSAHLIIDELVQDETEPVEKESGAWTLRESFLISVIHPSFAIRIVQEDEHGVKNSPGSVEIVTEQIRASASQRETYFVAQTTTEDETDLFLELSFTGYLTTSNINKGPSPDTVISVVKSMEMESIIDLLIQIVISDTAFMSPDQGLLGTLYGTLLKQPEDDAHIPRSLGLLANIHLARYDAFLKIVGDDADKYPMYPVYHSGIKKATSMLEKALTLAAVDHPKKQWMMISLCMCYQRQMVQHASNPSIFRNVALRMHQVVPNIDDNERQKSILSNYLGVALANCYAKSKDVSDLDSSIAAHEDAIRLTSSNEPRIISLLIDLVDSLSTRVALHGATEDIHRLLDVKKKFLRLTPDDNPDKFRLLMSLGHSFFTQFKESGTQLDIEDSIALYEQALELLPETDPLKPSILNNLAASLSARGTPSDLDRQRQLIRDAAALVPDTDPTKIQYLKNLGSAIRSQIHGDGWNTIDSEFQRYTEVLQNVTPFINENDVDALIQDLGLFTKLDMTNISTEVVLNEILPHFTSTITPIPDSRRSKSLILFDLGSLLFRLFEQRKDRSLINQSILFLEQSIAPSASSSTDPLWINALVQARLGRYVHFKALSDLDTAINTLTTTLQPLPSDHKDRPYLLGTLSNLHYQRFMKDGDVEILDQCIEVYREALRDLPQNIPQRFRWLSELGCAYMRRFEVLQDSRDIDKAIQTLEDGSKGLNNDAPMKGECIMNLARSLFFRFNQTCQIGDLDHAVAYLEDPVCLPGLEIVDTSSFINELYDDIVKYFYKFSGITDIGACAHEMELIIGDAETLDELRLHNIGIFLSLRFAALQGPVDQTVLDSLTRAVDVLPTTHRKKAMWLGMLVNVFTQQSNIAGDVESLDKAVSLCAEAIQHRLVPPNSIGTPLSSLAAALTRRFYQSGNLADLNKAIGILEDSVAICHDEEVTKYRLVNDLAFSLMCRYDLLGDIRDFNKSAEAYHNAMDLIPSNNTDKHALQTSIGSVYLRRLKMTGDIHDADEAIRLLKEHMESLPDEDPKKVNAMAKYSMAVLDRYWHFHNIDDINEAITTLESALSRLSEDSSQKADLMHDLGSAFAQRYVQRSEIDDINQCLSLYRRAQDIVDENDPHKYMLLFDIGRWLPVRYERLHDVKDLDDADAALSKASMLQPSPFRWRFRAASLRGYWCQSTEHGNSIEGYTAAMQLLPNLAWLGISIQNRQHQLLEVGEVVLDAVAAAIEATRYDLALEWLEQGRSITWGQILELRAPADSLLPNYPDIAQRFTEVSTSLGNMESNHDNALRQMSPISERVQTGSQLYHELADERDKLLQKIRGLDGFHNFLKPKDMASLSCASANGPVIAVNVNKFRCDALVLLPGQESILHIPLLDFSASEAYDLMKTLRGLIRRATRMRGNSRAPRRSPLSRKPPLDPESVFADLLAKLWTGVARPILDGIGFINRHDEITKLPHIWWCLTGPLTMLPIHAAGIYQQDDISQNMSKVSDYAVSSYIPSLGALINCMVPRKVRRPNLVAISVPIEAELPFSQIEIEAIQNLNARFPVSTLIESEATREKVLTQMQSAGWVHFACHGIQNTSNPNMSALMLSGGAKLTLSDISKLSLPHAEFAFLSACQTATGDELLPEEAVHLAAGMLSAGYQGVIGTMWSIFDDDGPKIADTFYSHLFSSSTPDPADAAYALQYAVKALREDHSQKASFFAWVPFIHYGI